jgi:hypothetical protein
MNKIRMQKIDEEQVEPDFVFRSRPARIAEALERLGWKSPVEVEDDNQLLQECLNRATKAEEDCNRFKRVLEHIANIEKTTNWSITPAELIEIAKKALQQAE